MRKFNSAYIIPVENSNDKVGIEFDDNIVKVFIPQVFRLSDNKNITSHDLLLFLKSLSIAKSLNSNNFKEDKESGSIWPIESYLWIIRDYLENGIFYNREKIFSRNPKGKINWKKTLKSQPIISNNNIIYDKLVTSRISTYDDILSQIFKYCLKQSQSKIGWLFNYNFNIKLQQVVTPKEMVYIVNKELSSTYDNIKKSRFHHMKKILKSIDKSDKSSTTKFSYTIDNYYYVFEKMIDQFLNGINDKGKLQYFPRGFWKLNCESETISSSLRPDTIYKKKDEIFIFDAKMYQYGFSHNNKDLPNTTSMQKQITYGDYIKHNLYPSAKIRSSFILPYNKELPIFKNDTNNIKYCDGNLSYIGEAYVSWRNKEDRYDYDRIFTFLIDFNFLLNNYNRGNLTYVEMICNEINTLLTRE